MTIDISEYRGYIDEILESYDLGGIVEVVSFCVLSGIPLIAGFTYLHEKFPEDEVVLEKIEALTEFYGYDGVYG